MRQDAITISDRTEQFSSNNSYVLHDHWLVAMTIHESCILLYLFLQIKQTILIHNCSCFKYNDH